MISDMNDDRKRGLGNINQLFFHGIFKMTIQKS